MRLVPDASEAMAMARIVCDLEPGMLTGPDKQDFLTVKIIISSLCYGLFFDLIQDNLKTQ